MRSPYPYRLPWVATMNMDDCPLDYGLYLTIVLVGSIMGLLALVALAIDILI